MSEKIVVFGAGGHAKVVVDAIESEGRYELAFLADSDASKTGSSVLGYPVRSEQDGIAAPAAGVARAIVAIGDNATRERVGRAVADAGLALTTVIHPAAIVARSARIGAGTLIMPGCIINAGARVGDNVIVNTGAVIEHDCVIGNCAHIAPNATLCGRVIVGAGVFIGAGAILVSGTRVGEATRIGAGSTVLADIQGGATAVGSPCRVLEKRVSPC